MLALERMEALLAELPAKDGDPPPPTEPPKKKPLVPIGKGKIGGHDREHTRRLRAGDELPHESKIKR